jgi:hypothetical protein
VELDFGGEHLSCCFVLCWDLWIKSSFEIFFSWSSSSLTQRGVSWKCYPFQCFCGADYLFSSFSKGDRVPTLWWGTGTLLQSQWGVLGLCELWEAGFLAPAK